MSAVDCEACVGDGSRIERIVHPGDPFVASERADREQALASRDDPQRLEYFADREVLAPDGTFPNGEGFLYSEPQPTAPEAGIAPPSGTPGSLALAGHRGTKRVQQDAGGLLELSVGGNSAAILVTADGVSASRGLAHRASQTAVQTFLRQVEVELADPPDDEASRHAFVELALERAAVVANFEVVRQVLLDLDRDGAYTAPDAAQLSGAGFELPNEPLTVEDMERLAPGLQRAVDYLAAQGVTAQTTFSAAVAVDNDLYTFNSGDSVVSLFRAHSAQGHRMIHLTERDQSVVELFKLADDTYRSYPNVFQNMITDSMGDSATLTGIIRRYPDVLRPGDRVLSSTDGIGPRRDGSAGLDREAVERILATAPSARAAADELVRRQLDGLDAGEYQDNIAVVVLDVR
ncbi:MAG: protein phosphatase 2C domain-containing protein [Myxococcota bacterium]